MTSPIFFIARCVHVSSNDFQMLPTFLANDDKSRSLLPNKTPQANAALNAEALRQLRQYVPPDIFGTSLKGLQVWIRGEVGELSFKYGYT